MCGVCACMLRGSCATYRPIQDCGKIEGMDSGRVVMKQKTMEGYKELGSSGIQKGVSSLKEKYRKPVCTIIF